MDKADAAVLGQIQGLFRDTESFVIAAFQVLKASRSSEVTGAQLLKALGGQALQREGLKVRVLALTVKRSLTDRGFRGSLHICKPADKGGGLQVRRSYPLKCLHDIRVLNRKAGTTPTTAGTTTAAAAAGDANGGPDQAGGGQQSWVELRFASHHEVAEHRGCYLLPDAARLLFFISLVTQVLRQQDDVLPTLLGTTQDKLDAWWVGHKDVVTAGTTPFALEVITPGMVQHGRKDTSSVLISEKEEADLEELLDMFAMGLGDLDTFNARLQEEQAALEAANVFAILQNTGAVDGVMLQLKRTQGILDDLDESLKVFDFKLRHMRDDIAAIEASNNTLERQSRHNAALLGAIRSLTAGLELNADVARVLDNPSFELTRLRTTVRSAWLLVDKLAWLRGTPSSGLTTTPGPTSTTASTGGAGPAAPLNPLLHNMLVVREARERLEGLAGRFAAKAGRHLQEVVSRAAQEVMAEWSRATSRACRCAVPDRARLRGPLQQYRDLITVLLALDPQALASLQQHYAATVNTLLRRELRGCSSELRKGVAAEAAAGPGGEGDYNMVKQSSSKSRQSTGSGGLGSDAASEAGDLEGWPLPRSPLGRLGGGGGRGGELTSKRQLFLQGSAQGLPLHEAVAHLAEAWLPFLADEAAWAAHALRMHKGDDNPAQLAADAAASMRPPAAAAASRALDRSSSAGASRTTSMEEEAARTAAAAAAAEMQEYRGPCERPLTRAGAAAVGTLLAGLDEDFRTLLEGVSARGQVAQAVPCLLLARTWALRCAPAPTSQPLTDMLARCCEQLLGAFTSWVGGQVAAVEAYDSKSKMGLQQGIKNIHVVPYISQFCLLAHDIEVLLAAVGPPVAGSTTPSTQEGEDPTAGGGSSSGGDPVVRQALSSVREDVDAAYRRLLGASLARLEATAASDPKYSERLRLENTSYLAAALGPLAGRDAVLREAAQSAEARRDASLRSYVQSQLEYGKLWRLLEFGEKLDKLLQVVSPPEVAFQKDCSAAEVRSLIRSTMEGADKKLEAMGQRVAKHLGQGPLARSVWGALQADLLQRYTHLEELLERCYPTTPLRPSPEELRELFKATSFGA